jgi:hypothetical protein
LAPSSINIFSGAIHHAFGIGCDLGLRSRIQNLPNGCIIIGENIPSMLNQTIFVVLYNFVGIKIYFLARHWYKSNDFLALKNKPDLVLDYNHFGQNR